MLSQEDCTLVPRNPKPAEKWSFSLHFLLMKRTFTCCSYAEIPGIAKLNCQLPIDPLEPLDMRQLNDRLTLIVRQLHKNVSSSGQCDLSSAFCTTSLEGRPRNNAFELKPGARWICVDLITYSNYLCSYGQTFAKLQSLWLCLVFKCIA